MPKGVGYKKMSTGKSGGKSKKVMKKGKRR